jgi:hypothetical protein
MRLNFSIMKAAMAAAATALGLNTTPEENMKDLHSTGPKQHFYPYPRMHNTGAARHKRDAKRLRNVRARAAKH